MSDAVVIVGAGVIGCALARELGARGVSCTIIDDRPVGGGATQASAGMLAPHVEAHEPGPLLDLGVRSLLLYDDWIAAVSRESGLEIEYRRIGTLEIALDPSHAADLRQHALQPNVATKWLDGDAARDAHPSLGAVTGALSTPTHGYVAAAQLTLALARAAERQGATFVRASVRQVEPHGSTVRVSTTAGIHDAGTVVIAAGAWGGAISGIRTPPLRPVRGQLLRLAGPADPLSTIMWGPDCYIVPRLDGTILVGATVEDVGFDERVTAAGVRDLLEAACELLPCQWGATFLEARVGLRPATPDELPVLGADPQHPRVIHASGHYRNGVLLAPITAQLIGDLIVERKRDVALDAFRPERFD